MTGLRPQLAAFVQMAFTDRPSLKAAEDRGLHRLGRAQVNCQFERWRADERSYGGEDCRPPEVRECHEADGVVGLARAIIAQAEPAAGDRLGGARKGTRAEARSQAQPV